MDMDQAPLNRAHQLERKAEKLNHRKKLDECIQCYVEAVEQYNKALQIGDNKIVLETIQMQKELAERQIRTLQLKKAFLERTEKEKILNGIASIKHSQKEVVENLEAKIFKNFETHDSLISFLAQRGIIHNPDKDYQSTIEEVDEPVDSPIIVGNKLPKDDSTVIEELKELSGQLRESVQGNSEKLPGLCVQLAKRKKQIDQLIKHINSQEIEKSLKEGLLIQLDDRNKEIEQLKARIQDLELEKSYKEEKLNFVEKHSSESSGKTSPSTDIEITELKSLPPLEPLVLPEIDISAFKQFKIPETTLLSKKN